MDAKIKTKWVKALRSGKYRQARETLSRGKNSFCCLGVLALIQGCPIKTMEDKTDKDSPPRGFNAGLTKQQKSKLVRLNDGFEGTPGYSPTIKRHNFKQIADYIAKNL